MLFLFFFFFQAEDGIRDHCVTGVQTCALPICWDLVQRDLRAVLDGELALDEQLARRRHTYGDRQARLAAHPAEIDVQFLDHLSDVSTVVDVRGPATLGALYRITRRFAELELDIRHARITTVGNQAMDSFYLVDRDAGAVSDPVVRRRLVD